MKVSIIGTGYVGLVSGTCFAEMGHDVTCIDISQEKINLLKDGKSPIYEPGLDDLLSRNIKANRLHFTTNYDSISGAKAVFLAVGTPSSDDGKADLTYLMDAAKSAAENLSEDGIIVIKSTVPVGTNQAVYDLLKKHTDKKFHVVNNPEFLKEGAAIDDFMKPDRVVIGFSGQYAGDTIEELYAPLMRQGHPIYKMSNLSAEMTKYAANCFLATKISFINDISRLCDLTGADIEEVRKGITSDKRIGPHFLYPGLGYGGSCFPKDVKALIHTAKEKGMNLEIVEAAEQINQSQRQNFFEKIKNHFHGDLKGRTIAFWGVAFKPKTDDIREAPAIYLAREIIKAGGQVRFYDPIAMDNYESFMAEDSSKLVRTDSRESCVEGADALALVTEWPEFRDPNYDRLKTSLKSPVIFDGRNIYDTRKTLDAGFTYYAVGKYIQ